MKQFLQRLALAGLAMCLPIAAQAQVSLTTHGVAVTTNFDTLPASGSATWTNNSTVPGWFHARTGTGTTIVANNGSSNAGNLYSYGTGTATDRALGALGSGNAAVGNLFWGVRLQNNTGATITSLDVSFVGEQWRNSAAAAQTIAFSYLIGSPTVTGSLAEFQSAGTAVAALNFTSPITGGTAGALDGNLAANRVALSATITGLSIPNGTEIMLRWADPDHTGADHGLAIDDVSVTPYGSGPVTPALSINDVDVTEGNAGTSTATFTISLSVPAGPGGVSFDIATADNTATVANADYVAQSLSGQTIPAGSSTYTFSVLLNGDTANEVNESYFVNVTNITGANAGDAQGVGGIINDDFNITPIHQIQGNGPLSPINGQVVITEGIVTAQKFNNGFFLQTADAEVDADPATSQGIFVFTSTAPPATATVGNRVRVTATVTEFTPGSNLNQLPITELVSPTSVQVLSTGNALPTAAVLTAAEANASATPDTLERYEGMRVSVAESTVVEGADGNITESSANASTTGVFQVVLAGIARPYREPGIGVMDVMPIPAGKTPPYFDTNQERLMVRSRGQIGATALAVDVGATISGLVGVLDYFDGTWAVLPDPATPPTATGGKTAVAVADQGVDDVTIGGFNLLRFFDEINDSNGAPTLTAAALDKRLTKTSLAICDYVKTPDILGVVEVENLRVLGMLADRINANCARAPGYVPYLVQGNDPGGINVGFLVSTRDAGAAVPGPRVEVLEVVQHGKTTPFVNPDSSTALLNDRPPLMLRAIVHAANGAAYPVTVFSNHLRSLNGIDDTSPGSSGWATEGDRVRNKRAQQALFLANLVNSRQQANPNEKIVLVGDFNAFEFNDGYTDVMGIIRGDEVPESEVLTWVASPVATPLVDGSALISDTAERYSYVFEGNAQSLDHVLVNEAVLMDPAVLSVDVQHPRINADFGVHHYGVAGTPLRVSDHDPVRVSIKLPAFSSADLSVTASVDAPLVPTGGTAVFRTNVGNAGPDTATAPALTVSFDALVAPVASPAAGWTCDAPAQDTLSQTTTVRCSTPSLASGGAAALSFAIAADAALGDRVLHMDATVGSSSHDPQAGNNSASAQVIVGRGADLSVAWTSMYANPAASLNRLTVRNLGPASTAAHLSISVEGPFGSVTGFQTPANWRCTRPSISRLDCVTLSDVPSGGSASFYASNAHPLPLPGQSSVRMNATVNGTLPDPQPANNQATIP